MDRAAITNLTSLDGWHNVCRNTRRARKAQRNEFYADLLNTLDRFIQHSPIYNNTKFSSRFMIADLRSDEPLFPGEKDIDEFILVMGVIRNKTGPGGVLLHMGIEFEFTNSDKHCEVTCKYRQVFNGNHEIEHSKMLGRSPLADATGMNIQAAVSHINMMLHRMHRDITNGQQ